MAIALKEAGETEYWLRLLYRTGYMTKSAYSDIVKDCEELIRLLTATVNTARKE